MTVAVVDFTSADAPERFAASLRDTGFAVLVDHPLPWPLVEQIYAEWSALFRSPAVARYVLDNPELGYTPASASETAKGATARDLKEFFHVYPWSVYPSEVSDAAWRYREIAIEITSTLLRWLEQVTPAEIQARCSTPLSEMMDGQVDHLLRILRYPPLPDSIPDGAIRAAAHEDINLLTLLPASDMPGLELLDTNGEWYPVPCDPGSIAINAGEMLDLATGGYYPATTHRVVNPTGPGAREARMSMPLFLGAADDVVLAQGRTAKEFLAERIRELRGDDVDVPRATP